MVGLGGVDWLNRRGNRERISWDSKILWRRLGGEAWVGGEIILGIGNRELESGRWRAGGGEREVESGRRVLNSV